MRVKILKIQVFYYLDIELLEEQHLTAKFIEQLKLRMNQISY
jgi:hypothetical protein